MPPQATWLLRVVQRAYQHRGGEMKGLKAALRSRDQQLQLVERKLRQLRDVANHDTQEVAEQFGKLKSEGQTHLFLVGSVIWPCHLLGVQADIEHPLYLIAQPPSCTA